MEYVQERVTTLHDFDGATPTAPVDATTVVVPLMERDHASLAAERVFSTLETVDPGEVLVALRASEPEVEVVHEWLQGFDLNTRLLWCTAPRVKRLLAREGLDGATGKGRDVWLALGVASRSEYVVVHDADATTYDETLVPRLLFGLTCGHDFAKGYYARVENSHLYGRLFRLFYTPLVRALREGNNHELLAYLDAFRYALSGEFAVTGDFARRLRTPRGWGLEVGTLSDGYSVAGFAGTAQVDLGTHEHDHRAVSGPAGLGNMCAEVGTTLFTILEEHGIDPDYGRLRERYRTVGDRLVEQYAADAAFNGLSYDAESERDQVAVYTDAVEPPARDDRLPAWRDLSLDPVELLDRSTAAVSSVTK